MIETLLSLAGTAFQVVSGVQSGRQFERLLARLQAINAALETLSDKIIYAPNLQVVRDISQVQQNTVNDPEQLKEYLEPIHDRFGKIVSSQMIITPERMRDAMSRDPWEVLQEIRPYERAKAPRDPDMLPISFEDREKYYIGWQKQGAMPMLFNCEYSPDTSLWLPPAPTIRHPESRVPEWRAEVLEKRWVGLGGVGLILRVYLDHETHLLTYTNEGNYEKVEVDGEVVDKGGGLFTAKRFFFFSLKDGPNSYQASFEALPNGLAFALVGRLKYRLIVGNRTIYTGS
jgi:hypothetical protein